MTFLEEIQHFLNQRKKTGLSKKDFEELCCIVDSFVKLEQGLEKQKLFHQADLEKTKLELLAKIRNAKS